jgi:hypothetical protein
MLKLKINANDYYVGTGVEMRRLWKRAVKAGFSGYKGDTTCPKYDIKGTYALYFIGDSMYWYNFKTLVSAGEFHYNKTMPDYRQYKGKMIVAKSMYEYNKTHK